MSYRDHCSSMAKGVPWPVGLHINCASVIAQVLGSVLPNGRSLSTVTQRLGKATQALVPVCHWQCFMLSVGNPYKGLPTVGTPVAIDSRW
eukprot:23573-Rhodomonas_salina.2